ncbi:ankyrin repeat domain-containing protein [Rickettsiales endosymbiont of Stachyamoeba lipophora]|uniref:ankyrin repeat domain-containing protein n=1 Tax=Rickettsiales endosymbiont of Stachyamoeba lipophora TaxID=2486578 RepID=UPI000F6474C9|nr:ankyrin repeat domain-containing protein [Rickettsiales endosymbiont of Stachyamoeba lipophora]AZL15016.1 ankyrin repeat domain-containing protein [Rickettsiales endosymbiont of Stachyamoeba lipophora]
MFSFSNILAQSRNQQIICDFINNNASGTPLEDVIELIKILSEEDAKTLLEYLFYLQWKITKQAETHRLALIRAILNNPHAQNLIKELNIIEPEVPAQDAIAEDTIEVVAGKNPQQQFKHIPNQYSVLLRATEANDTDLTWALLTNPELIKLSDILEGTIDIARFESFLKSLSIEEADDDHKIKVTVNDRSQKIAQFITIIKNQLPKNATAIELTKLLPLALEHTSTDIAQMLMNNEHDVNLSLEELKWIDDNKKEQHSLTDTNPIINTVINIVEAQNDIKALSNQLYILQALLLNPKADLNLYYTEDEKEAILVSEYVVKHLSNVFIKAHGRNIKLQLLHLITALDETQLKAIINELVVTFETMKADYQLTSEQQSILQALYTICSLKEPKLKLTDLIDENYFEQHDNLNIKQKAEFKTKLHNNKAKLAEANQNLLMIVSNLLNFRDSIKFIQQGADVNNAKERYAGKTALHYAAQNGDTKTVRVLVQELGADVNAKDKDGNTALHYAAMLGQTETARILVQELGADVNGTNNYGNTALYYAAQNGDTKTVCVLVQELGANINATDKDGKIALHYAALYGNTKTVRVLAQLGADVNATDKHGKTALYYAAQRGHPETVRVLVQELGTNVNAKDKSELEEILIKAMAAKQNDNASIQNSKNTTFHQQAIIKQRRLSQDNQRGMN